MVAQQGGCSAAVCKELDGKLAAAKKRATQPPLAESGGTSNGPSGASRPSNARWRRQRRPCAT
eukprot:2228969-Prorocentrum_lima.AAC.1